MKKFLFLALLGIVTLGMNAQPVVTNDAEELFRAREWSLAIKSYEKLLKFKQNEPYLYKIGECYRQKKDYASAVSYFEKITSPEQVSSEFYLQYGLSLMYLGKYQEAKEAFEAYRKTNATHPVVTSWINSCNMVMADTSQAEFTIEETAFTRNGLLFGLHIFDRKIYYSRTSEYVDPVKKVSYPRYGFKFIASEESKSWKEENFPAAIHSKFYLGAPVFVNNGNTIYFTGNDSEEKFAAPKKFTQKSVSAEGINTLNVYATNLENGKWSEPTPLYFNDIGFNCVHPNFSQDGKRLYFASDMPGGFGGYDLYVSDRRGDEWGHPVNLGDKINSAGDEMNPFFCQDSVLYFSSNGWTGYGGADIFVSVITQQEAPENLGKGINSSMDDFGMVWLNKKEGYFISNRESMEGNDGVFYFKKIPNYRKAQGTVVDKLTLKPIDHATIFFYNEDSSHTFTIHTNEAGYFRIDSIADDFKFGFLATKQNYIPYLGSIKANDNQLVKMDIEVELQLELEIVMEPEIKKDMVFSFEDILFDYDKATLLDESKVILDRLAEILLKYPDVKVEIGAHTDSRGNDAYNMKLSERRAASTLKYLETKGIAPGVIASKGYGESKIKNKCKNNVYCTEDEHFANRRVEVIVLENPVRLPVE